ncbi:MAG: hypothetical protein IT374_09345 [Polyangiaceae bacterium]|nr:hypothetical protein [Polyangiaceae bacterium]
MNRSLATAFVVASLAAAGCSSSPAAPFNQLPGSPATAFRLQNYEPPPTAATSAVPGLSAIPGLPPQIQAWMGQGAAGLGQLIPPGLIPPGLIPGMPTATAPVAQPDAQRFHGFRILQGTQLMDESTKEKIAKILGDKDNFESTGGSCMYPEMGLTFSPMGGVQNDVLISFSCRQVQAFNFAWPHNGTAMKASTVEKMAGIVNTIWPQ